MLIKKKDELNKKNTEIKKKFKEIAKLVNNKTFTFLKKVKKTANYMGQLNQKKFPNIIKEKNKAEVNASQIILKDELKKIGTYKVDINFHSEVKASISIKIDKIQSK